MTMERDGPSPVSDVRVDVHTRFPMNVLWAEPYRRRRILSALAFAKVRKLRVSFEESVPISEE